MFRILVSTWHQSVDVHNGNIYFIRAAASRYIPYVEVTGNDQPYTSKNVFQQHLSFMCLTYCIRTAQKQVESPAKSKGTFSSFISQERKSALSGESKVNMT